MEREIFIGCDGSNNEEDDADFDEKISSNLVKSSSPPTIAFGNYVKEKCEMSTFNHSSSYNRTYERKVIEEGGAPSVRITTSGSPLHTIKSTLGGAFPTAGGTSFINPHNYHFGTSTSGAFQSSDDSLSATLDVSQFAPEDLKVSVIGNQIVVEGHHAEKPDDLGLIERHFVRKFALPRNAHPDTVSSNLSADGQLSVTAHNPKAKEGSPARTIPIKIVHTPSPTPATANGQQQPQNGSTTNQ